MSSLRHTILENGFSANRRGIGGAILGHCLALIDAEGVTVRLEYLK